MLKTNIDRSDLHSFYPSRIFLIPRCLELLLQTSCFIIVVLFMDYLNIDQIVFSKDVLSGSIFQNVFILAIIYYAYKNMVTYTVVDLIVVDLKHKSILVKYWLFHLFPMQVSLSHDVISYNTREDLLLWGGSLSIRIYKSNRILLKLNARNGWKKVQVIEIAGLINRLATTRKTNQLWPFF